MIRENQKLINWLNVLADALLLFLSFPLGFHLRFLMPGMASVPLSSYLISGLIATLVELLGYWLMGIYDSGRKKKNRQIIWRIVYVNFFMIAILFMSLYITKDVNYSRGALFITFALENIFVISKHTIARRLLRKLRRKGYNQKFIVFVGNSPMVASCVNELANSPELGYSVIGYVADSGEAAGITRLGRLDELEKVLEKYAPDEVISALNWDEYSHMEQIINACEATGTRLYLVPYYAQWFPARPYVDSLNGIPLLGLRRVPLDNMANALLKRAMDVLVSLLLIIFTSPIMLVAAIGVKLSSPGPIIFRQERVGLEKKNFYMYKFRSMRVNAEEKTGWSKNSDPRKTRFGSFIRKYSIDELPQLFNVLKGDMSLVGPRPEVPFYVERFRREIPRYMVKHQVRPGMTGWAQIHGLRGDTSIEKRIEYDIYYIEHWSLLLDFKILLRTVHHVRNEEVIVK